MSSGIAPEKPLAAASRRLQMVALGRPPGPPSSAQPDPVPLALKTLRHRAGDISRRQIYGLEPFEFDALVLASQGRCMICGRRDEGDALTGLVIDHDHATERYRGLLCGICNRALYFVETYGHDDPWLRRVRAYLRSPEQKDLLWKLFDEMDDQLSRVWGAGKSEMGLNKGGPFTQKVKRLKKLIAHVRAECGVPAEDFYHYLFVEHVARVDAEIAAEEGQA